MHRRCDADYLWHLLDWGGFRRKLAFLGSLSAGTGGSLLADFLCAGNLAQADQTPTPDKRFRHHRDYARGRGGAPMKAIKAVYNFILGDMIILLGVIIA